MRATPKIAVIGAGIGGLAVTSALLKLGASADIYEQTSSFARVGAGIHVAPNAVKALLGLGLSRSELDTRAYPVPQSRYRDYTTGEILAEIPYSVDGQDLYGAPYTMWHRGDLHHALLTLVPDDHVHRNKNLIGIDAHGDAVLARFSDGTSILADALIASDGLHSVVRTALFGVLEPHFTGRVAYRAVLARDSIDEPNLDPHCKWWAPDRHLVQYHVSAGRELAFTTSVEDPTFTGESWTAPGDVAVLREYFASFHPYVNAILAACMAVNRWGIHTRDPLDEWTEGRVVLIGDACHTMTPYMGQGGAMAVEDAIVLARCMEGVGFDPTALPAAFRRYEATRKPRTSKMQAISKANTWGRVTREPGWAYGYDAWTVPIADVGLATDQVAH